MTTTEPTADRRRYVVVDLETTGLHTGTASPVEIAAVELLPPAEDDVTGWTYGRTIEFVPYTRRDVIAAADDDALATNRWFERRLYRRMLTATETFDKARALTDLLDNAVLVGANPAYDAAILHRWLADNNAIDPFDPAPWHFRLHDVEVAAEYVHNHDHTPSLREACKVAGFDIERAHAHTAMGDAMATAELFMQLQRDRT